MLNQLNCDIISYLTDYFLSFNSLINLSNLNKFFYKNVYIIHLLSDSAHTYLNKLSDAILMQPKYIRVSQLDAGNNSKITTLNHMTKLSILWADCMSNIDDKGIIDVNLEKLYANHNSKITNVNHMTKLKKLVAYGDKCGLDDNGIINVNLETLYISSNSKITNINHMTKLKKLVAYGDKCNINDGGIT